MLRLLHERTARRSSSTGGPFFMLTIIPHLENIVKPASKRWYSHGTVMVQRNFVPEMSICRYRSTDETLDMVVVQRVHYLFYKNYPYVGV